MKETSNRKPIQGSEDSASVFDPNSGCMLFFGGWRNQWLSNLDALNVSGIVGPPYTVLEVNPATGPLSGAKRTITLKGLHFGPSNAKIEVKFSRGSDEEIAAGVFISDTEIQCESPSFEKWVHTQAIVTQSILSACLCRFGAGRVTVKCAFGSEMFTVRNVWYTYYNDTKASNCLAFGPALHDLQCGVAKRFVIQVIQTTYLVLDVNVM